jgi:hypothetical protein
VVSMDFCFTRGLVEPEGASRRHQTIWWRSTSWSLLGGYRGRGNSVLCLPTPGKGRPHAKYLAEQVVRFITWLQHCHHQGRR